MPSSTESDTERKCRLVEILQYECTPAERGNPPTCFPLPRIFSLCPNEPAVELTAYMGTDGALMNPAGYMNLMPKTRPWRDILRERGES